MSMHQLIVADGQRAREIFDICRVRTLIGRAVGTDVQVRTPLASRMHALLSVQDDGVYVSDLDSFNGTYLNGRKVIRARV